MAYPIIDMYGREQWLTDEGRPPYLGRMAALGHAPGVYPPATARTMELPNSHQATARTMELPAPPPAPAEEYYIGMYEGVPSYTNIPELAERKGLRRFDLAPPITQVGGVEMYGTTEGYPGAPVTSKLQAAQMTGAFKPSIPAAMAPSGVPTDPVEAWKQGRDIYMKVLAKGQELKKTPEEIKAELEYRGVGKIDPWSPPVAKHGAVKMTAPYINEAGVTVRGLMDAEGNITKEMPIPAMPQGTVVVNTPEGPMVVTKGTGEAAPIIGPGGQQIKGAPTAEQSTMKGFFDSIDDSLKHVEETVFDEKGNVRPGIFGPIQGRAQEYGGKLPLVGENPKYEAMRTAVANLQDIVYPKSGKAINESELQNLYKYIPEPNDKEGRVKEKMANFKRNFNSLRSRMIGAAEAGGKGWAAQPGAAATGGGAMADLPSPTEHTGRIVKDTDTGKRYKSNGTSWQEVQ